MVLMRRVFTCLDLDRVYISAYNKFPKREGYIEVLCSAQINTIFVLAKKLIITGIKVTAGRK